MIELAPNNLFKSQTRILKGSPEEFLNFFVQFVQRSGSGTEPYLYVISDKDGPLLSSALVEKTGRMLRENSDYKIRYITDIRSSNIESVKTLMAAGYEVRHLDGIKVNMAVTSEEYVSTAASLESGFPTQVVWSDNPDVRAQMASVFSKLWETAILGAQRIRVIERTESPEVVEFIRDRGHVVDRIVRVLDRAKFELIGIGNSEAPKTIMKMAELGRSVEECSKRLSSLRYITDITNDNIEECKILTNKLHVDMRHIQDLKPNVIMTESEYLADLSPPGSSDSEMQVLYSNERELLVQQRQLFDSLWTIAVPARQRMEEIEFGVDLGYSRTTYDLKETAKAFDEFVSSVSREALIILPSVSALRRNIKGLRKLAKKARESGLLAHVLVPSNFMEGSVDFESLIDSLGLEGISFKVADKIRSDFACGIYDGEHMIAIQLIEPPSIRAAAQADNLAMHATITTNKATIANWISIFEALWNESESRQKEMKTRRQAELLQDIIAHDVRNYNQVAHLGAELLKEELKDNPDVREISESILNAVEGSSELIDKARKLGKLMMAGDAPLRPVKLIRAIDDSFELARSATREKQVVNRMTFASDLGKEPRVMADDLLGEIFVNIFANSVKYTESSLVEIDTLVEDCRLMMEGKYVDCLKVSIADRGRGIPEALKKAAFSRYLESAKGSGLGMSIMYTLAVERYHGRVILKDRVPDDNTKGTVVEVWLPKALT